MVSSATYAGEVSDQLHLYHDPFASTTAHPKIPDGKIEESVGLHLQDVREATTSLTSGELEITLFPGLGCIGYWTNGLDLGSTSDPTKRQLQFNQLNLQSSFNSVTFNNADLDEIALLNDQIAAWRLVSAGVQFKLLNPTESDDGWWEAMRYSYSQNPNDWNLTASFPPPLAQFTQGMRMVPAGISDDPSPTEKSYATGLLRDLGRVQFDLNPTSEDHIMRRMQPAWSFVTASNSDFETPIVTTDPAVRFRAESRTFPHILNQMVDTSFDMIIIKFHCRPTVDIKTRLHVNSVANYEVQYKTDSDLALFHSPSHNIGDTKFSVHKEAKQNPSAATVVLP